MISDPPGISICCWSIVLVEVFETFVLDNLIVVSQRPPLGEWSVFFVWCEPLRFGWDLIFPFKSVCVYNILYDIYLDLPNDAKFLLFQKLLLFWGTCIFFCLRAFFGFGTFWALGPPITVLTNIWTGVISRPKSVKINQVGRHSLAAKTPNMKRRYFWKRAKNIPNSKKSVVSTSSDNFAQPEVPGIYIYIYVDLYMVHIWWVVFLFKYEYDSKSEIYWTIWCSIRKSLSPGQGFLVLCSDLTGKQTWENHGGSMCLLGWFIFFCWRLCGYWGNEFGRSKTCWDLHRFWVMLPTSILYRWVEVVELIAIWYPETWSLRPSWWLNLGAFASFLRRFDVILCV